MKYLQDLININFKNISVYIQVRYTDWFHNLPDTSSLHTAEAKQTNQINQTNKQN